MGPGRVDVVRTIPWLSLVQWPHPLYWEPPSSVQPILPATSLGLLLPQDSKLSQMKFASYFPIPPDTQGRHLWVFEFFCTFSPPPHVSCPEVLSILPSQSISQLGFLMPPSGAKSHCVLPFCHTRLAALLSSVDHTSCPKTASKGFALSCTILLGKTQLLLPDK